MQCVAGTLRQRVKRQQEATRPREGEATKERRLAKLEKGIKQLKEFEKNAGDEIKQLKEEGNQLRAKISSIEEALNSCEMARIIENLLLCTVNKVLHTVRSQLQLVCSLSCTASPHTSYSQAAGVENA
jgi:predicted ribosome quality control (RQC) complex YloA/Tae2 family protein